MLQQNKEARKRIRSKRPEKRSVRETVRKKRREGGSEREGGGGGREREREWRGGRRGGGGWVDRQTDRDGDVA